MKLFVCNRSTDLVATQSVIAELLAESKNFIAVQQEIEHSENWKKFVEDKMNESDFVLFVVGADTFESEQIIWEYAKAKDLNKRIIGYKLPSASQESILFCQGFQIFEKAENCYSFLDKVFEDDRKLKFEQYKIMVSSTEKVTDSRLKVNNLFLTVSSTIISIGFVLGKTFGFTIPVVIGMLVLTALALLISYSWEKLINSYALLNKGKFKVIDKIEKQLRTNMFEDEWKILTQEIKYKPNSETEKNIVKYFRVFVIVLGILELIYLGYLILPYLPKCGC
ncbi:TIR domain-containing protein [Dokdonia sp. Hel_I_53]|uniref:RipA family octameric membrane protein n=1 Tax=Dokdonia sp. Hel_I_53 TaxID=1566287 RepID=UPI00119AE91D|nr:TIR domain-containing protein [Dokdonia sp. Hel_I_53]TVZ51678.1 TIR domain-containing protein [Dokdonia sp. Hel_I_53]